MSDQSLVDSGGRDGAVILSGSGDGGHCLGGKLVARRADGDRRRFLLILALLGAFGIALAGISFVPALLTKNEQATGSIAMMFSPVVFTSAALVLVALMQGWMQAVNEWSPITFPIEAGRSLMPTGRDWAPIGKALLATAILGTILQDITLWAFDRLAR